MSNFRAHRRRLSSVKDIEMTNELAFVMDAIHRDSELVGVFSLSTKRTAWFGTPQGAANYLKRQGQYEDLLVTTSGFSDRYRPGPYEAGKAEDVASRRCLFADVDVGMTYFHCQRDALEWLRRLDIPPCIIISTRPDGGLHALWVYERTFWIDSYEDLESERQLVWRWHRWLAEQCPSKLDSTSLTNHVRMPETVRPTFGPPYFEPVRLTEADEDQYDRKDLIHWLDGQEVPRRRKVVTCPARECRRNTGTAYGLTALENAIQDLLAAGDGERHTTCNRVFFSIGRLVGGGELNEDHAQAELEAAFEQLEWNRPRKIDNYWRSFAEGVEQPRSAPPPPVWGRDSQVRARAKARPQQ